MALDTAALEFLTHTLKLVATPRNPAAATGGATAAGSALAAQAASPAPPVAAAAAASATAGAAEAATAPLPGASAAWTGMRGAVDQRLGALKQSVLAEFAGEDGALLAEIEKTMAMLDVILERLDHSLASGLEAAHAAPDEVTRAKALAQCRALVQQHRAYVDSEPLIAHIDSNPLGIDVGLRALLDGSLDHVDAALPA